MADVVELYGGPPAVDQSGNLTIWWVPTIVDVTKPKLTEIGAGKRITYSFLPNGWGYDATTEKLPDDRLTDPMGGESLGRTKPTFNDLLYVDSTAATSAAVILKDGGPGYFVERRNVPQTALGAIADKVRVLQVTLAMPTPGETAGAGKFSRKQAVAISGGIPEEVAVVA